jgi:hypothetical protein
MAEEFKPTKEEIAFLKKRRKEAVEPVLRIGDMVMWRGAWGSEPAKVAKVTGIEVCAVGTKNGMSVSNAKWTTVKSGKKTIVVDLDNGHWAYGSQLDPIE